MISCEQWVLSLPVTARRTTRLIKQICFRARPPKLSLPCFARGLLRDRSLVNHLNPPVFEMSLVSISSEGAGEATVIAPHALASNRLHKKTLIWTDLAASRRTFAKHVFLSCISKALYCLRVAVTLLPPARHRCKDEVDKMLIFWHN